MAHSLLTWKSQDSALVSYSNEEIRNYINRSNNDSYKFNRPDIYNSINVEIVDKYDIEMEIYYMVKSICRGTNSFEDMCLLINYFKKKEALYFPRLLYMLELNNIDIYIPNVNYIPTFTHINYLYHWWNNPPSYIRHPDIIVLCLSLYIKYNDNIIDYNGNMLDITNYHKTIKQLTFLNIHIDVIINVIIYNLRLKMAYLSKNKKIPIELVNLIYNEYIKDVIRKLRKFHTIYYVKNYFEKEFQ